MSYWEKVGGMNKLMKFSKEWKTLKEVREEFNLTSAEAWKLFRRVIKNYDEFEHRDSFGLKAGTPIIFRTTEKAYMEMTKK